MIEVTEALLPVEIWEAYSSIEYEEKGRLVIKSVTYEENDLTIIFELTFEEDSPKQVWDLRVVDVHDEKIVRTWATEIKIYTDHYLLWQFTDENAELYVNGTDDAPEAVVANFYALHQAAFGEWLSVETYISDLFGKARSKYAQFAKGPKKMLEYYATWLGDYGRNPYFLNLGGLIHANSFANRTPLKLLTFGECYFIGQDFVFNKQSG